MPSTAAHSRTWIAVLAVLAAAIPVLAAPERPPVTVRIEEQSACRLLAGGYMVSFTLRTSYGSSDSETIALVIDEQRVTRALVSWKDSEPVTFASPVEAALDEAVRARDRAVTVGPGQSVEGTVTAHVPLSTDPSDWLAALLPGDYHVRFALRVPVVDPSGTIDPIETTTSPLPIRIPDPTAVQECPFDLAPPDMLLAP